MTAQRRPSPALGIGYSLWLRGRSSFAAACLLVLALAFATQVVPAFRRPFALGAGLHFAVPPILFGVPIVLLPVVSLLNVFTYGPIDVSSKASPFPMHARLLPLSTRALVGWPMLFGVLTLASLWLVLLAFVLRPLRLTTSIVWPTTIVIACTAWAQTMAWVPLPFRFIRAPLFLAVVGIPFCFATVDPRTGDYFWSFEAGMAMWAVAAYVLATLGMKRARRGSADSTLATARPSAPGSAPVAPPFASASAARRWYELRRTTSFFGKTFSFAPFPFVVLCVLAVHFPHSVLAYPLGRGGVPVSVTWTVIFLVCGPLLASAALGGFLGRFDHGSKPGLASFFALRPVSTMRIVADKLVSAGFAAAILFASSTFCAVFAFWAYTANAPPRVQSMLVRYFADRGVVDAALVAVVFAFLLWRNLAVDLWTTMTGRTWPSRVVACYAGLAIAALPAAMAYLATSPEAAHDLLAVLPWLVRFLVVLKLGAATAIACALVRRSLVSPRAILAGGAIWCVAVALLLAGTSRFVDISWTVASVVAAVVPLARILFAPLALDRLRHA